MAFKDIFGHDKAVSYLRGAIARNRAGASLLFHGPPGIGRRTAAIALAQAFNCTEEPGEGCGSCSICSRVGHVEESTVQQGDNKGDACAYTRHADVRIVVPGKDDIRISEVRSVRQQAQRKPFEGIRSVFIFDPAERMTVEAANALLKTLEEPPPTSCLVLIASDPSALLPTIRSRCRLVPFHPLAPSEAARFLEERRGMAPGDASVIARLTGGRIGAALSFDLEEFRERRRVAMDVLGRLRAPGTRAHVPKDAELLGARGDKADALRSLEIIESLLRDLMILGAGGPDKHLIHPDLKAELSTMTDLADGRAEGPLTRIAGARRDLSRNVNRQLLLETFLLDLAPGRRAAGSP